MTKTRELTETQRLPGWQMQSVAWVAVQLGVIWLLARAFHLENAAFQDIVLPLAFGGFLVHHWLPRRLQPLFFAAISLTGIVLIFGVSGGLWLIGVGLGLILLCHVPIPFWARVALIAVAGGVLIAMRGAWVPTPVPGVIWPILGSMFMFRLAIYLYDLKHRGPSSPGLALSYFFMLPNTVFLLFPVIDFQTFKRTHYDRPAMAIYSEGVRWMFRGLTHLVLYRLVYQYVALSPDAVTSTAGIVQYLVGNFALYLRVSGQFHLIVGLLHLFGFRLPETHRFFYLASGFSDLWRRINIYWKDFMQKMVYLPVMFGLKRRGETTALVGATIAVVGATWFLHSYQWFWLLGTWLFSETDMVFWGILGVLLILNTLREQRRGRERQLTAQGPRAGEAWRHAVQTAGMFALMAVLWGFWTAPTFEDFMVVLRGATFRPTDAAAVLGTLSVVAAAAFVTRRYAIGVPAALAARPRWQHPLAVSALPLALFWGLGEPALAGRVPASVQAVAQHARLIELNKYDAERMQRGYYEKIVGVNRYNGQLWEIYARGETKPETLMAAEATNFADFRDEFGNRAYRPLLKGTFTTNRWGMRDKDYEIRRPAGTLRIAIVGPSYVVGAGVDDSDPFEVLVEDRLNREWSQAQGLRTELLNFGLAGASLTEEALMLTTPRVSQFTPNVVILVGHLESQRAIDTFIWRAVTEGRDLPEPLTAVVREAGLTPDISEPESKRRLAPHGDTLIREALKDAAKAIRRMGATPIFALIPMPLDPFDSGAKSFLLQSAAQAGFGVIDMQDLFLGYDAATLVVGQGNYHPNVEGHRIAADRFYIELMKRGDILPAPTDAVALKARADLIAAFDAKRAARIAETVGTKTAAEASAEQAEKQRQIRRVDRSAWVIQANNGAAATMERQPDGVMRLTITALPQKIGWHVKLRQAPLALTKGNDYRVKFRARATAPRPMGVGAERHRSPFGLLGFYESFEVTTNWQTWEWTFTASATESNARLFFDLGESQTPAEIADVVLVDMATGRPVTLRPDSVRK